MTTTRRQDRVLAEAREGLPEESWPELDKAMSKTARFAQARLGDSLEDLFRPALDEFDAEWADRWRKRA